MILSMALCVPSPSIKLGPFYRRSREIGRMLWKRLGCANQVHLQTASLGYMEIVGLQTV